MKRFTLIVYVLFLGNGVPATFAANAGNRPNILYFYVDDLGWGAIGPNGQAERMAQGLPYVLTPNLDRLAVEGINFTRSYGCAVCSSQQSGFHQGHTFADRNDPNNAKKAMRAGDVLMGDVMVGVTGKGGARLRIKGAAQLAGTLVIVGHSDFRAERGKTYPLIQAESVSGRYKDVRVQVNFSKGAGFDVVYSKNSVVLQVY